MTNVAATAILDDTWLARLFWVRRISVGAGRARIDVFVETYADRRDVLQVWTQIDKHVGRAS